MNLKELGKRIDEILSTEYHSNRIINKLIQKKEIEMLIYGKHEKLQ